MDFDKLYQDNFLKVQQFCQKWTDDADDAKDIAQESFIELMRREKDDDLLVNSLSWVYRVAYNRCINRYKYRKRFVYNLVNDFNSSYSYDEGLNRERLVRVRKAMQRLNHKERALVTLYKLGFSYRDMAEVVEMNPTSVGKTLTRAIDKLAKWVVH
ncbi:MAG: RNA polymerase sigma factor [Bacteroidales bacterium]|nr:RNA polymerase sigma factor [Bacteroidales bacterium]MDD3891201.1 RNA polymerase sigma factor [Bacteroidales bacterium]